MPFNVIIIVIDALRRDYSTFLENKLVKLGFISYENVIAPAPWTLPSFASLFTGLYPSFHGAHETKNKKTYHIRLNKKRDLLSLQLQNIGYETYLISPNIYVSPYFGFSGFQHYYDSGIFLNFSLEERLSSSSIKRDESIIQITKKLLKNKEVKLLMKMGINYLIKYINWPTDKGAINTLKIIKKIPLTNENEFIFISLMETHEPYFKHQNWTKLREMNRMGHPINKSMIPKLRNKYMEEVRYVTKKIVNLIKIFRDKNIFDDSLIIITSDHGQLLGEYGKIGHGTYLYDELLRIPLLIKYPNGLEINRIKNTYRYASLTNLKSFILQVIKDDLISEDTLYSATVFAESYGVPENIKPNTKKEMETVEKLEKHRIAIYYKNFKGIFNVSDWRFEKLIPYNDEYVPPIIKQEIKNEVLKFLNALSLNNRWFKRG